MRASTRSLALRCARRSGAARGVPAVSPAGAAATTIGASVADSRVSAKTEGAATTKAAATAADKTRFILVSNGKGLEASLSVMDLTPDQAVPATVVTLCNEWPHLIAS